MAAGQAPMPALGLKVNAFATGLDHPRWIEVLPNGDVLVAEAMFVERPPRSLFDYAMISTMRRADAIGVSATRITLLRDADGDGDGVAEICQVFPEGLNQPFGMALLAATPSMSATPTGWWPSPTPPRRLASPRRAAARPRFKPDGHWTRSLPATRTGGSSMLASAR